MCVRGTKVGEGRWGGFLRKQCTSDRTNHNSWGEISCWECYIEWTNVPRQKALTLTQSVKRERTQWVLAATAYLTPLSRTLTNGCWMNQSRESITSPNTTNTPHVDSMNTPVLNKASDDCHPSATEAVSSVHSQAGSGPDEKPPPTISPLSSKARKLQFLWQLKNHHMTLLQN